MIRNFLLSLGLLILLIGGTGAFGQTLPPASSGTWPNQASRANSDDWLLLHHDQIRQMRPRLLVLNFVNGLSQDAATKKVQELIAALRESSRYHGYANPDAPPFLDYQIFKLVDLTDP